VNLWSLLVVGIWLCNMQHAQNRKPHLSADVIMRASQNTLGWEVCRDAGMLLSPFAIELTYDLLVVYVQAWQLLCGCYRAATACDIQCWTFCAPPFSYMEQPLNREVSRGECEEWNRLPRRHDCMANGTPEYCHAGTLDVIPLDKAHRVPFQQAKPPLHIRISP
jgi:hypothetical protein